MFIKISKEEEAYWRVRKIKEMKVLLTIKGQYTK